MEIKIIKNRKEYNNALAELDKLMDLDPDKDTPEGDKLKLLSLVLGEYEEREFPIELPHPIEAIKFRMEQQGLKRKDLIPYIGSKSKVSEVLSGKRPLSLKMIRALHENLGISFEVLMQDTVARTPAKRSSVKTKKLLPEFKVD
jgi:HTH-type transcriptional regulator/antitoxin HigA